jgi:hypothetical protein
MRSLFAWLVVLVTLLVPAVLSEGIPLNPGSDVIELVTEGFDERLKTGDWLIEFYAPWVSAMNSVCGPVAINTAAY